MSERNLKPILLVLFALATLSSTGCATYGPSLGIWNYGIPVSPYFQDKKEREHWEHERYERAPILGPISSGGATVAVDTPSDDEVMRAFEHIHPTAGGLPLLYEVQQNNVRIVKEKIADYVDPPRVMPLVGPVQLHHAHYKCTVYYTEIVRVGWPVPHTLEDEDAAEVIYIDHNHLHMVGNVDPGVGTGY
jgi:hypothetical protein